MAATGQARAKASLQPAGRPVQRGQGSRRDGAAGCQGVVDVGEHTMQCRQLRSGQHAQRTQAAGSGWRQCGGSRSL
jgi:hypothetical protein